MSPLHRLCAVAVALVLAPLVIAAPAGAAVDAARCAPQASSQPFAPWHDYAQYVPVPGGTFPRGATSWDLGDAKAKVVADVDEPFRVDGDDTDGALALPDGSSATSPAMCVDIYHPTMRFFAQNTGDRDGRLRVEVLFELQGTKRALTIGVVSNNGEWAPSPVLPVVANLLSLITNQTTDVAFRFSARGGSWLVDGVYVDPWGKG